MRILATDFSVYFYPKDTHKRSVAFTKYKVIALSVCKFDRYFSEINNSHSRLIIGTILNVATLNSDNPQIKTIRVVGTI